MVEINNPPVSRVFVRVAGLVLCVGGLMTAGILVLEFQAPSASRAEPKVLYPIVGFLATVIAIAIVQGARMLFARRPEATRLPTPILWFGAALLIGSAGLQVVFLTTTSTLGNPWQILLGLGGSLGAIQLIRRRAKRGDAGSTPPGA